MKEYYNAIQNFHNKFKMKGTNNKDMRFRLNLIIEELGELSQSITKGKNKENIIEENVDLLNLIIGNFISLGIYFEEANKAFWHKHKKIMNRKIKKISNNIYRVSKFKE